MSGRTWPRRIPRRGAPVAALALGATLVSASPEDSLAELARRAREKRPPAGSKVYTDADLRSARPGAPDEPSPRPTDTPPGDQGVDASDLDRERGQRQELERTWRERFDAARGKIQEAEPRAWRTVIRAVTGPGGVIVPMEVREYEETDELRQARRALADLEEELRRAGLPAGWGR
jgi:hypothetical protein